MLSFTLGSPRSPGTSPRRSLYSSCTQECNNNEDDLCSVGSSVHTVASRIDIGAFEQRLLDLIDEGHPTRQRELEEDDDTEILEIFPIARTSSPQTRVSLCLNQPDIISAIHCCEGSSSVVGDSSVVSTEEESGNILEMQSRSVMPETELDTMNIQSRSSPQEYKLDRHEILSSATCCTHTCDASSHEVTENTSISILMDPALSTHDNISDLCDRSLPQGSCDVDGNDSHRQEHRCPTTTSTNADHTPFALCNPHDFDMKIRGALFGRDNEVNQLRQAFGRVCRGSSEVIHVRGSSGSGKTQLVTRALQDYVSYQCKGHFVSGKFDQLRMNEPFSAVLNALVEWCNYIVDGDSNERLTVSSILNADDPDDLSVLMKLVPPVKNLCGKNDPLGERPSSASSFSFFKLRMLCCKLAQALSAARPSVLFLDDLQWADPPSRSLVQALCSDMSSQHVLFVVACRDKEYHTLRVDLLKNCDRSLATSTVVLKGFNHDRVTEFLTSVLGLEVAAADTLANFLTIKTNGNIHHIIQYVKRFRDEGLLFSSSDSSKWHWDTLKAEEPTASIDDLFQAQVLALDPPIQYVVSLAACIGYRFDIRLLIASVETQYDNNAEALTRQHLTIASRMGFIAQVSHWDYRFSHDKIQQAFYSIIRSLGGREAFHLTIGNALSSMIGTADTASDALIFLAVDHMNQGSRFITGSEQRLQLARLNLLAGRVSMDKVAYDRAAQYFRNGIQLLSSASTWTDNYNVTYELHKSLAFAAHCTRDFEETEAMVAEITENAASTEDALESAFIKMESLAVRGEHEAGIKFTLKVLSMIQFPLDVSPNRVVIAFEAARTRRIATQYDTEVILRASTDALPSQNAVMKALNFLTLFACYAKRKKKLFALASLKMMQVTYRDGLGPYSACGFIWYGILQEKLGNNDIAERFYSLGCSLANKMRASQVAATALIVAEFVVNHRQKPLVETYSGLKQAFNSSLRFHDSRTSVLGALGQISAAFYCGDVCLAQVEEESRFVVQYMRQIQSGDQLRLALPIVQASVCLQGNAQDPGKLFGNVTDGDRATVEALNEGDAPCVELTVGLRLLLALAFEKWSLIQSLVGIPIDTQQFDTPHWTFSFTTFIRGIACLNLYRRTRKRRCLREGLRLKRVLQSLADRNCPGCERKFLLLKAESMSLNSHLSTDKLQKAYTNAIEGPGGCTVSLLDAALANERAALVMMERNDFTSARRFAIQAINCYSQWGATAKVRWMGTQFGTILRGGDYTILDSSDHTGQSVTFGSDSC